MFGMQTPLVLMHPEEALWGGQRAPEKRARAAASRGGAGAAGQTGQSGAAALPVRLVATV